VGTLICSQKLNSGTSPEPEASSTYLGYYSTINSSKEIVRVKDPAIANANYIPFSDGEGGYSWQPAPFLNILDIQEIGLWSWNQAWIDLVYDGKKLIMCGQLIILGVGNTPKLAMIAGLQFGLCGGQGLPYEFMSRSPKYYPINQKYLPKTDKFWNQTVKGVGPIRGFDVDSNVDFDLTLTKEGFWSVYIGDQSVKQTNPNWFTGAKVLTIGAIWWEL
jgi:hypothetical protein